MLKKKTIPRGAGSIGDLTRWCHANDSLALQAGEVQITLQAITEHIIHIRASWPEDEFRMASAAVVKQPKGLVLVIGESGEFITASTSALTVTINRRPLRISIYDSEERLITEECPEIGMAKSRDDVVAARMSRPDEYYYGFGEKFHGLNKRGQKLTMWNTDNPHRGNIDPLYVSVPFYITHRAGCSFGLFYDHPCRSSFDMAKSDPGRILFRSRSGYIDYYFIAGPEIKSVVRRFTDLVGRMPLPPRWALGHQQSRWSYYPDSRVREIAETFRKLGIPTDVIYLDIHYMDGYRVFTFDPQRFPDIKKLTGDLKRQGFRTVSIIDPGVKVDPAFQVYQEGKGRGYFSAHKKSGLFTPRVWPGKAAFPDFFRKEVRDWWAGLHQALTDAGVAGVWNDMNEPSSWGADLRIADIMLPLWPIRNPAMVNQVEGRQVEGRTVPHEQVHNLYGMMMSAATRQGLEQIKPQERPFVLTRSGYAGIQRYAAVWTGDNLSRFRDLRMSIPMLLNMGLSGIAFAGADIGGFGLGCNPELYARWIELGVFYPFCRTHTALHMPDQEPWSFGPAVTNIAANYIKLRYLLLPWLYSLFHEAHRTGLPIMRPMVMEFPKDPAVCEMDDQFMMGCDLLIAPVLDQFQAQRRVYLPKGLWTDFWSEKTHTGPMIIDRDAPLGTMPIFVREGAVLFMQPLMNYTDERPADRLVMHIYPGNSERALYEDDGISLEYLKTGLARTTVRMQQNVKKLAIEIGARQGEFKPPARDIAVCVHLADPPARVLLDGMEKEWNYSTGSKIMSLRYDDDGQRHVIEVLNK